jgi:PAS domain S-box-containing protein
MRLPQSTATPGELDLSVLDDLPVAVIVTDPSGTIVGWNEGAHLLYGWTSDETVGRSAREVLVPVHEEDTARAVMDRVGSGRTWEGRLDVTAMDGRTVPAQVVVIPVLAHDGSLIRTIGVSTLWTQLRPEASSRSAADRLEALRTIADTALSHLQLDSLLTELVERISRRLDADTATILLSDDEQQLRVRASVGRQGSVVERLRIPFGRGIAGRIAAAGRPILFADIRGEEVIGKDLRNEMRSILGAPMIVQGGRTIGVMHVGSSTPSHFIEDDIPILEVAAERAAVAVENWRLFQAEQEARVAWQEAAERVARLGVVIAKLSAALTEQDVIETLQSEAVPFLGATGLWVFRADEAKASLRAAAVTGYDREVELALGQVSIDANRPSAQSVRTGEPLFAATIEELTQRFRELAPYRSKLRQGGTAVLPMATGGAPFGALILQWDAPRRFDEGEKAFLATLTGQVAQALDRARLYGAERAARTAAESAVFRTNVLQSVTAALSAAITAENVAEAVFEQSLRLVGAETAAMIKVRADDGSLQLVRAYGDREAGGEEEAERDDAHPVARAIRSGEPVVSEDRRRIVLPLLGTEGPLGALELAASRDGAFGPSEAALLSAIADQSAVAFERALLHDQERREWRRSAFLDAIGELLSHSLNYERTVARVARLVARGVGADGEHIDGPADYCAISLLADDGSVGLVAIDHADASWARRAREWRAASPLPEDLELGVPFVLRTGRSDLIADLTERLRALPTDRREAARGIAVPGVLSAMAVPLRARGRTFGAIEFLCAEPDRAYTRDDLGFAERVAERASFAIDNARLFKDRADIARTLQRALRPADPAPVPGVDIATRHIPAGEGVEVGGDFYEIWGSREQGLWVAIGDVTGKGPGAVDLNVLARHTIRAAAMGGDGPAGILETLNRAIIERASDERFCTAAVCRLDLRAARPVLTAASGGHPLPLIVRGDGTVERVGTPGTLIGLFEELTIDEQSLALEPGETLVLYTDGVIEERRGARQFGLEGLVRVLESVAGRPAEEVANGIEQAVRSFRPGGELLDDVALVVVRPLAASGEEQAG